jgi:hypothetical protein
MLNNDSRPGMDGKCWLEKREVVYRILFVKEQDGRGFCFISAASIRRMLHLKLALKLCEELVTAVDVRPVFRFIYTATQYQLQCLIFDFMIS